MHSMQIAKDFGHGFPAHVPAETRSGVTLAPAWRRILYLVAVTMVAPRTWVLAAEPVKFRIATFSCDVTPPLGQPIYPSYRPLAEVEHPLLAKGILLDDGQCRYVLCAVDWCELCNATHTMFRQKLAAAVGTDVSHVAVQTVHQHTAPMSDTDAMRLLESLDNPPPHPDPTVFEQAADRLAAAVHSAAEQLEPFDRVGAGQAEVIRVASTRRNMVNGKIVTRYSGGGKDPVLAALPEGKIDPLVKTITFARGDRPLVRLHYYATHPQSFYGDPRASYDVPGMARERLEQKEGVPQIYFTGCAGDVTMGKYNDRTRRARDELADRLYAGMEASAAATRYEAVSSLAWRTYPLLMPPRNDRGHTLDDLRAKMAGPDSGPVTRIYSGAMALAFAARADRPIEISSLQIGSAYILNLPGEALIDFQLYAQQIRSRSFVAVAAYGDCGCGYICPRQASAEGGYEPSATRVGLESEDALKKAIRHLLELE